MLKNLKFAKIITLGLMLFIATCKTSSNQDKFYLYKVKLQQKALNLGFDDNYLEAIFAEIKFNPENILSDHKQFSKKQNFNQYYHNAVNLLRLKKAKNYLKKYQKLLKEIANLYQIQPEYIIALWAIESDFGQVTGNYNVINSIFNLAFEGRRRKFFEAEFFAALKIIKENNFNPKNYQGSWAGATGQCQFMPSTYLNYAIGYNLDGQKDIWHSQTDIFASIANYLNKINWNYNLPYGYEVKANKKLLKFAKKNKKIPLKKLQEKYQLTPVNIDNIPQEHLDEIVQLISYEDRVFVLFNNFYVIKEWNNSNYFALTIGIFAEKIK
ncbi:MAG: lytic murein transglycosylase [Rickettsiales bacterium]